MQLRASVSPGARRAPQSCDEVGLERFFLTVAKALASSLAGPRDDELGAHEGDPVASRLLPRSWVFWRPTVIWLVWTLAVDIVVGLSRGVLISSGPVHGLLNPSDLLTGSDWPGLLGEFLVLPLLVGYYFWTPTALIGALRRLEQESVLTIRESDVHWWREHFERAVWLIVPLALGFGYAVMRSYEPLDGKLWIGDQVVRWVKLFASWIPLSYMTIMLLRRLGGLVLLLRRVFGPDRKIVVKPLHPDGAGGLEPLAGFALKLTFFLGLGGADLILIERSYYFAYGLGGTGAAVPEYIMAVAFVVGGLGAFFAPLLAPHRRMREAKATLLKKLSARYERMDDAQLRQLETLDEAHFDAATREMESLRRLHELVRSFPVWPFDAQILVKLVVLAFGQPAAAIVTLLLRR